MSVNKENSVVQQHTTDTSTQSADSFTLVIKPTFDQLEMLRRMVQKKQNRRGVNDPIVRVVRDNI